MDHLIIGMDEAGYGPNLGPFVSCLTAFAVPKLMGHDLWSPLAAEVCRANGVPRNHHRLIIDDSKAVHRRGFRQLERGVLAFCPHLPYDVGSPLFRLLPPPGSPRSADQAKALPWHSWIPSQLTAPEGHSAKEVDQNSIWRAMAAAGIKPHARYLTAWEPWDFNRLVEGANNKSAILSAAFTTLLAALDLGSFPAISILSDRHGGRRDYQALLATTFPDFQLTEHQEESDCSEYILRNLKTGQRLQAVFAVQGEQRSFATALASMTAKYWREVHMKTMNRYFQQWIPGIQPTAGYPQDARRFWQEISSSLPKMNLAKEDLWRMR